jgi:hypothetical protein
MHDVPMLRRETRSVLRTEQRRGPVTLRGECLCCSKVSLCTDTSFDKIMSSYTCPLFEGISEPVYMARITMMQQYGATATIESMLMRRDPNPEGE